MRKEQLERALGQLDESMLEEVLTEDGKYKKRSTFLKVIAITAAALVIISAAAVMTAVVLNNNNLFYLGIVRRIGFNDETLGDRMSEYIDDGTIVTGLEALDADLPDKLPIYRIKKHIIPKSEFDQMMGQLDLVYDGNPMYRFELKDNRITGMLASPTNISRGCFDMTDAELERTAWEIFGKMPFAKGDFEYLGIRTTDTLNNSEGTYTTRVGVIFRRLIDGVRVMGNDRIEMIFDGTGLVELFIELYDYEKIGTIELTPLSDAEKRIKTPDSFGIDDVDLVGNSIGLQKVDILRVDQVKLRYYNLFTGGYHVLQPVYAFIGTAIDVNGTETEFRSVIIAVPEANTAK